jgi:hypothetical protein
MKELVRLLLVAQDWRGRRQWAFVVQLRLPAVLRMRTCRPQEILEGILGGRGCRCEAVEFLGSREVGNTLAANARHSGSGHARHF